MLFPSKRARPDTQEAVAFPTTRVSGPDKDDCKKLGWVVWHLRVHPTLPLTLEADDAHAVKWWVDASLAVHPEMRSHTGATMSMGKGSVHSAFIREKLNTKSSTEAELVAVDGVVPVALWTRHFPEAQGHNVSGTDALQDNQSAMLPEKNGRASSGRRTRHVNIRCFFAADRVKSGEIGVKCCPTDDVIGDCFTKPLSGAKFKKFRKAFLNLPDDHGSAWCTIIDGCGDRSVLAHAALMGVWEASACSMSLD